MLNIKNKINLDKNNLLITLISVIVLIILGILSSY